MKQFGYIGQEFINLYSSDNPVLENGEQCYSLITNNADYHRPLICKTLIVDSLFTEGMNIEYFMKILEICEIPTVINNFVTNRQFLAHPITNGKIGTRRNILISQNFDFNNNIFNIEGFFVRNSLEKIIELRREYLLIIKSDIEKQLSDINIIL